MEVKIDRCGDKDNDTRKEIGKYMETRTGIKTMRDIA